MVRYMRGSALFARRVVGELLLVPVDTRSVQQDHRAADLFVLNETGEFLWERLQSPHAADELAAALAEEFEIDPAQAKADVDSFLQQLDAIGALKQT